MIYSIFVDLLRNGMKGFFRLSGFAFLLLSLGAFAAPVQAQNARKQIYVAVQLYASDVIRNEAKRRHWPDYQAKMNLFIPAEAAQLPTCGKSLSVSFPGGDRVELSRIRLDVRCDEGQGWDMAVTVKPDIYLPIVVARQGLERGHVIAPDDISIKKLNISNTRGNYVTQPDEVMGLTVKRRVRELQPIAMNQLDSPVLVERGQRVMMIAEQGGVQAQTVGEAMKKGRKGEMIKVKNESSERIVSAIVTDSGVVRMVYASGQ
ncbi:flagellar basal body P-ring formation chaperone FlgA [Enterobacter asburiae]|uniref:flagellar basal body P-ring formation chaperone FlgA n=1 Tax=Scandinavium sp. UTDF21-P1B TaxID=3446379 RepID=UPI0034726770